MKTWKDYRKETYSTHNNPIRPYSTAVPTAEDIAAGKLLEEIFEKVKAENPEGSQFEIFNALMAELNK